MNKVYNHKQWVNLEGLEKFTQWLKNFGVGVYKAKYFMEVERGIYGKKNEVPDVGRRVMISA